MAWRCEECTRYWGRCHAQCPLCQVRMTTRMALHRRVSDVTIRRMVLDYMGSRPRVLPIRQCSQCWYGTAKSCRCLRCKSPLADNRSNWNLLARLGRKNGRGRAIAARWVYLLSGVVSATTPVPGGHGVLEGMFMAADISRGPHVRLIEANVPAKIFMRGDPRPVAFRGNRPWRWFIALFLQYLSDRSDFRGLLGSVTSLEIDFLVFVGAGEADRHGPWSRGLLCSQSWVHRFRGPIAIVLRLLSLLMISRPCYCHQKT